MITTTRRLLTKFSAIFQLRSLKTKVTTFTLGIFLISILSLAIYSSYALHNNMERALGEQQFSTVSIIAAEINAGLGYRMKALENIAAVITPAMLRNAPAMQKFLDGRKVLPMMFNGGFFVLLPNGTAIADFPLSTGRHGLNFMDRKYASGALQEGKTTIGNPVKGKALRSMLFSIAVPIHNAKGKVIGALAGTVDLAKPNFISRITDNVYGKTGGYLLIAPTVRTIVFATDKKRILEVLPAPGINSLIDRFVQGYDGSGITIRPADGVEILASAKVIPAAGWYVVAQMPTEEAFAPIRSMLWRIALAAIFLTMLAGFMTWLILKRQLEPVFSTIKALAALSETDHPPQPLTINRQDEIGELIGGFNHLLKTLVQRGEALRESEANYRQLFDNAPTGIYQVDFTTGKFTKINDIMCEYLGCSQEEIPSLISYDFLTDESKQLYSERLNKLISGEKVPENPEYEILDKNGRRLWVLLNAKYTYDSEGRLARADVVAHDITERRRAQEEKQLLEERLNRSEKMESLGLLAGGVAHDLNNVLGIVVGYAELVLDEVDEKSPLRKDLKTIFDGGQRAAAIVDDLLTLARRGVVGKKVLNLNKLIGDFKKSPQWEKLLTYHPHVQILTDLDPDLLNIAASSVHLEKTLYNLISNAGEAMAKSGNITIKTSNKYIDNPISGYDTVYEGDYVVLSVSDEGDGISETDLKRIFEPFYTKKIMGRSGTGLGLSVVWGTVKDHQGYIDVQSKEGKGTTFTLYFLITREDIPEDGLIVSTSEYQGNGESILIVDDVKAQRDLAARLLTSLNYKVSSVSSGEDAIKYLKENKADLLILDMIMDPGIDGLDTYKSVLKINPIQKAIIVSGFSESDRVKEAKTLGAGAYIKKPYIKEKLGLAVKKELERTA